MKALIAALAVGLGIGALVLWFSLARPWSAGNATSLATPARDDLRCEGALRYRDSLVLKGYGANNRLLQQAEHEITQFCGGPTETVTPPPTKDASLCATETAWRDELLQRPDWTRQLSEADYQNALHAAEAAVAQEC